MAADPMKIGNISSHHMSQLDKMVAALIKTLLLLWGDFGSARDDTFVSGVAAESARQVMTATLAARKLNRSYQTQVLREMGLTKLDLPKLVNPYPRADVTPLEVYSRPAKEFVWRLHLNWPEDAAREAAQTRLEKLVRADLTAADRDEADTVYHAVPKVVAYRRVLHPELALKTHHSCGLCVVAANQIYKLGELKAIHTDCHCDTVPAFGNQDPGFELNQDDLKAIYAAAGGTQGSLLKDVRIAVGENGELGPVLVRKGDHFRSPEDVGRKPYVKPTAASMKAQNKAALAEANSKLDAANAALAQLEKQFTPAEQRAFDFDHLTPEQSKFVADRRIAAQAAKYLQGLVAALVAQERTLA